MISKPPPPDRGARHRSRGSAVTDALAAVALLTILPIVVVFGVRAAGPEATADVTVVEPRIRVDASRPPTPVATRLQETLTPKAGTTSGGTAAEARSQQRKAERKVEQRSAALKKIRKLARQVSEESSPVASGPATFRIGTFNILGSQHTAPGGDKPGSWPSGAARMPGTLERIRAHGVSVLGVQEAQPEQLAGLVNGTGFNIYPGADYSALNRVNSILYDPAVFEFVSGSSFQMSNGTGTRAQPILRLRHIASGREMYFVNAHPPAGHTRSLTAKRLGSISQLVGVVNGLKSEGLPVFLTGDMNDRQVFAQRLLPPTAMVAAIYTGGGAGGPTPVDWIVATSGVSFTGYTRDATTISRRISDHFFIAATATVSGAG